MKKQLKCRICKRPLTNSTAVFRNADGLVAKTPKCRECYELVVRRSVLRSSDIKRSDKRHPVSVDISYHGEGYGF